MQGYSIKNKSDLVPDEIFGRRLLISLNADKNELKDNIRCARILLSSFPDLNIEINAHLLKYRHKNPEYLINGYLADRKGVESENGITAGFISAKEQGCKVVIIDLDRHPHKFPRLKTRNIASKINNRREDFFCGAIAQCYVVFDGQGVKIDKSFFSKDSIKTRKAIEQELQKIKGYRSNP